MVGFGAWAWVCGLGGWVGAEVSVGVSVVISNVVRRIVSMILGLVMIRVAMAGCKSDERSSIVLLVFDVTVRSFDC